MIWLFCNIHYFIEMLFSRTALKSLYARATALLVHVDSLRAFDRVLPSKIFEYAATGKPVIAGIGPVAGQFLRENVARFSRHQVMDGLASHILSAVSNVTTAP